ncbi:hypothetical protein [Rhodopseudomonas palustris]|uniref:hypothetical protein n=1 Tax=Rhodopseudomonas palustris TaxID=1076 RepID=UPI0011C38B55|nr:hypothetical protein [Rhodopseudomonas palustris]
MRRRDLIAALAAAAIVPRAAWSDQSPCDGKSDLACSGEIPLDYDDARFSGNAVSSALRVSANGTVSDRSITETGSIASIVTCDGAIIRNCRVNSRECIRICGNGTFVIDHCYLEALGVGSDHADVIQTYSPGSRGTLKVSNTAIVTHGVAANVGLFIADNWTGTIDLENVAFIGGGVNYGLRVHPDVGGDNIIRLKNVFFIPPFRYRPYLFGDVGRHRNIIERWEDVRLGRIMDGKLVAGPALPKPF